MTALVAWAEDSGHMARYRLRTGRGIHRPALSPAGITALGATPKPRKVNSVSDYIQLGQIYVACNPRDLGADDRPRRIRILTILAHSPKVEVETIDADGYGSRRRWMYTDYLHASPLTSRGVVRTRGYVLETVAAS